MGQRERIGGGPGRDHEGCDLALEQVGEHFLHPPGHGVAAIAERKAIIHPADGIEDRRRDAGSIVTREIHA